MNYKLESLLHSSTIPSAALSSSIALPPAPSWPMIKDSEERVRRNTPTIGESQFSSIRENGLVFIDKSMLIQEFLRDQSTVSLILRPRRSGKTIASTMIYEFFRPCADRGLFRSLNIFNDHESMKKIGQFPCVLLSLADLSGSTWEEQYQRLVNLIAELYRNHAGMLLPFIEPDQQTLYNSIRTKAAPKQEVERSLRYLSMWYFEVYYKYTIFVVDEYDRGLETLFQSLISQKVDSYEQYDWSDYTEAERFYGSFFQSALKDNKYMYKSMMFGVSRVAKAGIMSGLNNVSVYTALDNRYIDKFGFTQSEVDMLFNTFQLSQNGISMDQIKKMYNGYQTSSPDVVLYNSWSLMKVIHSRDATQNHWGQTGSLASIRYVFVSSRNETLRNQLSELLSDRGLSAEEIRSDVNYRDLARGDECTIWNLLFHAGYCTAIPEPSNPIKFLLKIPNDEVRQTLKAE